MGQIEAKGIYTAGDPLELAGAFAEEFTVDVQHGAVTVTGERVAVWRTG